MQCEQTMKWEGNDIVLTVRLSNPTLEDADSFQERAMVSPGSRLGADFQADNFLAAYEAFSMWVAAVTGFPPTERLKQIRSFWEGAAIATRLHLGKKNNVN